jgi:hypothetical protein
MMWRTFSLPAASAEGGVSAPRESGSVAPAKQTKEKTTAGFISAISLKN